MGDVAKGLCLMRSAGGWASISVGGLVLRRGGVMVLKIDGVCISNRRKKGGSSSVSSSQCSRVSRRGLGIREKKRKRRRELEKEKEKQKERQKRASESREAAQSPEKKERRERDRTSERRKGQGRREDAMMATSLCSYSNSY